MIGNSILAVGSIEYSFPKTTLTVEMNLFGNESLLSTLSKYTLTQIDCVFTQSLSNKFKNILREVRQRKARIPRICSVDIEDQHVIHFERTVQMSF